MMNKEDFIKLIDKLIKEIEEESINALKDEEPMTELVNKMIRDVSLVSLKEKLINELYVEELEYE